jgi:hypothetical protein
VKGKKLKTFLNIGLQEIVDIEDVQKTSYQVGPITLNNFFLLNYVDTQTTRDSLLKGKNQNS